MIDFEIVVAENSKNEKWLQLYAERWKEKQKISYLQHITRYLKKNNLNKKKQVETQYKMSN